jgi:hypothetical protein
MTASIPSTQRKSQDRGREKGALRFWKRAVNKFYRMAGWRALAVRSKMKSLIRPEKRVLAICDFEAQPFSLGNMLEFNVGMQILCETHRVSKADLCIVCDPQRLNTDYWRANNITPYNYHHFLNALLPVAFVNPMLGSLLLFEERDQFDRYISDTMTRYHVWPSLNACRTEFLAPRIRRMILDFYKSTGYVPRLSCRKLVTDWARWFLHERAWPEIPIAVSLRNNPVNAPHRNSQIDCWLEFFQYCRNRFSVKFIVVCAASEIDKRLRDLPNVVLAKDFHTSIEQDMALIQMSAGFFAGPSGPYVMAMFNDKPYAVVNWEWMPDPSVGLVSESDGSLKWVFASAHQRGIAKPDTTPVLIEEFSRLYAAIQTEEWKQATSVANPLPSERMIQLR